ncbi:hypothetical protein DXG01_006447 [Tephrocybe rancida]|nr:hypothetical protein DXG01_006447 [Tephrocybe rancida]
MDANPLYIPEILENILSNMDMKANAVNMRVCVLWMRVAWPLMWQRVCDTHHLRTFLKLLAPWSNDGVLAFWNKSGDDLFEAPPTEAQWSRFLLCATWVRTLRLNSLDNSLGFGLQIIITRCPAPLLLPNLTVLECGGGIDAPTLAHCLRLIHPGLRTLIVRQGLHDPAQLPFQAMRDIVYIEIPPMLLSRKVVWELGKLRFLRTLEMGHYWRGYVKEMMRW